jgi:hypothetical protein
MYTLLKTTGVKTALSQELPGFAVALLVAQLFFKWGSFSLELIGFLVTWWVLTFLKFRVWHRLFARS